MVEVVLEPASRKVHSKSIEFPHLACSCQTGNFPARPRSFYNYLIVLHYHDISAILEEPMPNRKNETLKEAILKLLDQEKQKGFNPTSVKIGNEVREGYLSTLEEKGLAAQLALPYNHRKIFLITLMR